MTRNARERVYCRRCRCSRVVESIVTQWRRTQYLPHNVAQVYLPDWARMVAGHMVCGHPYRAVITLNNLALIRKNMEERA